MMALFQRVLAFALLALTCIRAGAQTPTPVLVELFTSEGCSSCPPADNFLRTLDQTQPLPGVQLIVLGEHVDYWDDQGWRDIYSDHSFTVRQDEYVTRMGLKSSYTPEIVVDGAVEFSGNDRQRAAQAFEKVVSQPKVGVQISNLKLENGKLHAHVEAGAAPKNADLFLAVALDHAESQVLRGENSGHRLGHVAVLRSLEKVAKLKKDAAFAKDVEIKANASGSSYRLIAFIQEPNQGKILGVAMQRVAEKSTASLGR